MAALKEPNYQVDETAENINFDPEDQIAARRNKKRNGRFKSERDNLIFFAEKSGIANASQLSARELKLRLGF